MYKHIQPFSPAYHSLLNTISMFSYLSNVVPISTNRFSLLLPERWYNYAETSKQILAYKGIILSRREIIESKPTNIQDIQRCRGSQF